MHRFHPGFAEHLEELRPHGGKQINKTLTSSSLQYNGEVRQVNHGQVKLELKRASSYILWENRGNSLLLKAAQRSRSLLSWALMYFDWQTAGQGLKE